MLRFSETHSKQRFLNLCHRQKKWAYYEPVGILISGTGRPQKNWISRTLKNHVLSESKNFFGERHCLMCRFGWENKNNFVMGTLMLIEWNWGWNYYKYWPPVHGLPWWTTPKNDNGLIRLWVVHLGSPWGWGQCFVHGLTKWTTKMDYPNPNPNHFLGVVHFRVVHGLGVSILFIITRYMWHPDLLV